MNGSRILTLLLTSFLAVSCSELTPVKEDVTQLKKAPAAVAKPAPKPVSKPAVTKPAVVKSKSTALKTYSGLASWYSIKTNHGRTTASGRLLSNDAYTAAHKTLPFGTKVRVTSLFNGKSEILRITDRGPYIKGRIIDVTIGSAKRLGFYSRGITKVKVEVLEWGTWKYKKP